ncbi:MAG: acyltransferase [Anaerolineales bacterium]
MNDVSAPRGRLFAFDSLRVLAVGLLLFHHSNLYDHPILGLSLQPLETYVGVFLNGAFFFTAGYFVLGSLKHRTLPAFYWSKVVRIVPPYWLGLLLFIYVVGITLRKRDVLIYALGLQTIFSPAVAKPVLTLWFVGVIILYYAGFAMILRSTRTGFQRLLGVVLFFALPYLIHLFTDFIDDRFFLYFFVFVAGLFVADSRQLADFLLSRKWIGVRLLAALVGWFLFYEASTNGFRSLFYMACADSFILTWIALVLALFFSERQKPLHPLWSAVAYASFFVYLFHRPVWQILVDLFDVPFGSLADALWKFLPGSLLTLFLSYYLQKGYDWLVAKLKW